MKVRICEIAAEHFRDFLVMIFTLIYGFAVILVEVQLLTRFVDVDGFVVWVHVLTIIFLCYLRLMR